MRRGAEPLRRDTEPPRLAAALASSALRQDHLLSSGEVAALLAVSPRTVARWAADEGLPAIRTMGGHRRYRWSDVKAWLVGPSARGFAPQVARSPG
jgi:excisionase family DNA binding protein